MKEKRAKYISEKGKRLSGLRISNEVILNLEDGFP